MNVPQELKDRLLEMVTEALCWDQIVSVSMDADTVTLVFKTRKTARG